MKYSAAELSPGTIQPPMRAVWATGLLALALLAGLALYLSPLQPGVLALQFAFTPASFGEVVHFWSAQDLQRYRHHLPVDVVLLASYGLFGQLLVGRTKVFHALGPRLRRLASWLLPAAAGCDAMENALHWWLTEVPRFGAPLAYTASGSCSVLKWALILAFGLLLSQALFRSGD